jgi:serine/threonine-protein kinase
MLAVKVFTGDGDQQDSAEHEFNMLSHIREMAVKNPQHTIRRSTLFMRFIPGRTLFQCIAEHQNGVKPMTILERLVLSRNLFAALQKQVHRNGLVHRDIKPENIMVGPDGKITIVDYNLAKVASHDDRGDGKGTAIYAPPEAFDGGLTGPQSDIYSMGRTVWQLFDWNVNAYRYANSQEI